MRDTNASNPHLNRETRVVALAYRAKSVDIADAAILGMPSSEATARVIGKRGVWWQARS
jgi:hypothetical protein